MTQVQSAVEAWNSFKVDSENIIQPLSYHEDHVQIGWNSYGNAKMIKKGVIVPADHISGSQLDFSDVIAPWVIKTKDEFSK